MNRCLALLVLGAPLQFLEPLRVAEPVRDLLGRALLVPRVLRRTRGPAPRAARGSARSASALWALATDNTPNKDTIAKLGGIDPLLGLHPRLHRLHDSLLEVREGEVLYQYL